MLNENLLQLAARDFDRLIVELPPRHGKSELISKYFTSWYLGTFPDHRVMLGSYEARFASTFGRAARDILAEYGPSVFGVHVSDRYTAAHEWSIRNRLGSMVTAGTEGGFTGRGGNLLIIDDPVKNHEEANSKVFRDKVWEWYLTTFATRMEPDAIMVVVMTRWSEDDLVGRLLRQAQEEGGEQWKVVNLPAIAEKNDPLGRAEGEALWRARYDEAALERIRRRLTSYWWSALYQQKPLPAGGRKFKREWVEIVDAIPAGRAVRYWDGAASDDPNADYTVGTKMVDPRDSFLYVDDVVRVQETPYGVEKVIKNTASQDGRSVKVVIEEEPGSAGKAVVSHYQRDVLPQYEVKADRVTGPKELRADYLSSVAEQGRLRIRRAPWNKEWLDELEAFPFGANDDQVDSASGAANQLAEGMDDEILAGPVTIEQRSPWDIGAPTTDEGGNGW